MPTGTPAGTLGNMDNNGNTIKWRVERLEKCNEETSAKLDAILTNHLPHIQGELEAMKARMTILAAINLGAVLIALMFNHLWT